MEKNENKFIKKLLEFFHHPKKIKFIIRITNYGPLGLYDAEKKIITINMRNPHPIETIKHEMIHLMIERFVRKYNIEYLQKELIVDSIFNFISKI